MKATICITKAIFLLALIFGVIGIASAGDNNRISTAEAMDFMSGAHSGGASVLTRSRDGIKMAFDATGLEPGAVYTAWWAIFNKPDQCSGGMCGPDDLSMNAEATQASLLWASGSIVGQDGIGRFEASLGMEAPVGEVVSGPGLLSPRQAEAHIVLRTHGAPIPGMVHEQISTLQGGCSINTCRNEQAAMHIVN
jgi:hypothetical protein